MATQDKTAKRDYGKLKKEVELSQMLSLEKSLRCALSPPLSNRAASRLLTGLAWGGAPPPPP